MNKIITKFAILLLLAVGFSTTTLVAGDKEG